MSLSQRIQRIQPSPTLAASAKAKALIAQGRPIINFGPGEPDFDTPDHIKAAAIQALHDGKTKYAPVPGIMPLREAVCRKLERDNQLHYTPEEIIITCGAKETLFAAMQVLLSTGDEVIIPAPYWVSYSDQVKLCDGTPVIVSTTAESGFILTPEQLRAAITPHTKMLILNTPSNPTGMLYSKAQLQALGTICQEHGIWVLSDEIYETLTYAPATFTGFGMACPEHRDHTIIINGASKAFAMTGWRIGWAAGPQAVIKKMCTWQGQVVSSATTFAQFGTVAAYEGPQEPIHAMNTVFAERRDIIVSLLQNIPDIGITKPDGAFYAFPDVSAYIGRSYNGTTIDSSNGLVEHLLEHADIALVAGEGFGAPGFVRFSYAVSNEALRTGLQRFADALAKLS